MDCLLRVVETTKDGVTHRKEGSVDPQGRRQGTWTVWVIHNDDEEEAEPKGSTLGPSDGKASSSSSFIFQIAPYKDGEKNGRVIRFRSQIQQRVPCPRLEEIDYVRGTRQGSYRKFSASGTLDTEASYVKGSLHGFYQLFRSDGTVYRQGWYKKGLMVGRWREWSSDGELIQEEWYGKDGQLENVRVNVSVRPAYLAHESINTYTP